MTDLARTPPRAVEARYYDKLEEGAVRCRLCPRECRLIPGTTGACRTRRNVDGRLVYLYYGACSSMALDPVEKKPLYHFHPGHTILSLGSIGCNLQCAFCQNWQIAQSETETVPLTPAEVVELARERVNEGCVGVAYTYNEPLVGFEFVLEAARAVRRAGLKNVLVTNGEINPEPLAELLPYVDALNVDVKGFTEEFYQELCRGKLAPVLRTVETAAARTHVELTNLLIPGKNDSPDEVTALVEWVAERLGPDVPLHFSRYFPQYKLDLPPTPLQTLREAAAISRRRLNYVYLGNVGGAEGSDTLCPKCGAAVIRRHGYSVRSLLRGRECPVCGYALPVVV
ncbi:MAG: AmmeMemoRadiSam system radical SAM enzyme [Betaproteobacteria bacterium]